MGKFSTKYNLFYKVKLFETAGQTGLFFCKKQVVVLLRCIVCNRECSPIAVFNNFSEVNNLPNMAGIMRQLPVNGIHNKHTFLADVNGF